MFASCASVLASMSRPHSGRPAVTRRRCHSSSLDDSAPDAVSSAINASALARSACRSKASTEPRSGARTTVRLVTPIRTRRCVKAAPDFTSSISAASPLIRLSNEAAPSPTSVMHDVAAVTSTYFASRGFTYFLIIAPNPTAAAAFVSASSVSTVPSAPAVARILTSAMTRPFVVSAHAYSPSPPRNARTSLVTSPVSDSAAFGPLNCIRQRALRSNSRTR